MIRRQAKLVGRLFQGKPEHYFAAGQVALGVCLIACLVVVPHYFFSFNQGGVSNYGTEGQTEWLFILGFAAAALGTVLAAATLPRKTTHRVQLRLGLYLVALLYLLVLLSTFSYKVNTSLRQLHEHAALVLFVAMFLSMLWLRYFAVNDTATRRGFIVFGVSFGIGILNLLGVLHLLFLVEITCGAAFGYTLSHGIAVLRHRIKA